ncbi:MAG: hypothetical protein ACOZE5_17100 [Verrucomicrobiota bacterium]
MTPPDQPDLHAISIQQPWLDMILREEKTWEIRGWELKRRGLLALHCPWGIDYAAAHFYGYAAPWKFRRGAIVGLATVAGVRSLDGSDWMACVRFHRQPLPFAGGHFAIELTDVFVLPSPVEYRGKPGTFGLDPAAAGRVWSQYAARQVSPPAGSPASDELGLGPA